MHEALGDAAKAAAQYKKVLTHDASNVEAIACMAANHFYSDQPELALRFYRRLLQVLLMPLPTSSHTASHALAHPRTPSHTDACMPPRAAAADGRQQRRALVQRRPLLLLRVAVRQRPLPACLIVVYPLPSPRRSASQ